MGIASLIRGKLYGSAILAGLTLLAACTDRRIEERQLIVDPGRPVIQDVAYYQHNAQSTRVFQMTMKNGSLYLTGTPFAFARWDFSADPEVPQKVFAASDFLLDPARPDRFANSELGPWTPQAYGRSALAIKGRYAYMSGDFGMSVVDIGNTSEPREVKRYQGWVEDAPAMDSRFIYTAMLPHPSLSKIFAFRSQDYLYTLNTSSPTSVSYSRSAYPGGNECCVRRAAYMPGSNLVFVALRTRIMVYELLSNGSLSYKGKWDKYQAQAVYATSRYIYIHHRPTSATANSGRAIGIYILDKNGRLVGSLPLDPYSFAVHDDDTHIYVNMDDRSVRAVRILWENILR